MKAIVTFGLVFGFCVITHLSEAQQAIPEEKLKALFPSAVSFKASKKTVTAAKRAEIEKAFGQKLADTDLQQQFYIAMKKEGGPEGVAYFGTAGAGGEFGVAVGADGGLIVALKVFAPADSPLAAETFTKQFVDRTVSTVKPPAPEQQALVDFLRAQDDNMLTMDEPQKSMERKIKSEQGSITDEPAAYEKGMDEYTKLLAAASPSAIDSATLAKFKELNKETIPATKKFSAEVKAAGGDWAKLNKAYKAIYDSCEKCHADYNSVYKKKRADLVTPRGASQFIVGKEVTAPAGQDAAAQALATEVKKGVALAKVLYSLK